MGLVIRIRLLIICMDIFLSGMLLHMYFLDDLARLHAEMSCVFVVRVRVVRLVGNVVLLMRMVANLVNALGREVSSWRIRAGMSE